MHTVAKIVSNARMLERYMENVSVGITAVCVKRRHVSLEASKLLIWQVTKCKCIEENTMFLLL